MVNTATYLLKRGEDSAELLRRHLRRQHHLTLINSGLLLLDADVTPTSYSSIVIVVFRSINTIIILILIIDHHFTVLELVNDETVLLHWLMIRCCDGGRFLDR